MARNAKSTSLLRGISFAATITIPALATPHSALAADFTHAQCRLIAATGTEVAKAVGPENLSQAFKQSFRDYLGANLTCDGSKDIFTPEGLDVDAFNTIRRILLVPPAKISLEKAGLRSVDPASVTTRSPAR